MHNFVTEMCPRVHISATKLWIVGYLPNALWDLWDGSIATAPPPHDLRYDVMVNKLINVHVISIQAFKPCEIAGTNSVCQLGDILKIVSILLATIRVTFTIKQIEHSIPNKNRH